MRERDLVVVLLLCLAGCRALSRSRPMKQWRDATSQARDCVILPLSSSHHKGSSGRVGVLGGNACYTGAPYYAAMAALHAGVDLVTVFTAKEAAMPIKCYSPELMVKSVYEAAVLDELQRKLTQATNNNDETAADIQKKADTAITTMVSQVVPFLDRLHCVVIGPGLGRCPLVFQAVHRIIQETRERDLFLVLDADALFFLAQPRYRNVLDGYEKVVLTPNIVEYKRLFPAGRREDDSHGESWGEGTIIKKGSRDEILQKGETRFVCEEVGGMKRSGGIGDVLAGTVATFLTWQEILSSDRPKDSDSNIPLACWTACCMVRRATKTAFDTHGRAMTAPNILQALGPVGNAMTTIQSS